MRLLLRDDVKPPPRVEARQRVKTKEKRPSGLRDADTVLAGAPDVKMGS